MESFGVGKYCHRCTTPIFASTNDFCSTCLRAIQCSHPKIVPLLKELRCGQPIKCMDCTKSLIPILCPNGDCNVHFYVENDYRPGNVISCPNCSVRYRQIVCACGQCINQHVATGYEVLTQGNTLVACDKCKQRYYFTVCNHCNRLNYHRDIIRQGQSLNCMHCKQSYVMLWCPQCYTPTPTMSFKSGSHYTCTQPHCAAKFEYTFCPACLYCNFTINGPANDYFKKCSNSVCGKNYIHMTCDACQEPLYIDNLVRGGQYKEQCAKCKKPKKLIYCDACPSIHVNDEKCQILEEQKRIRSFLGVGPSFRQVEESSGSGNLFIRPSLRAREPTLFSNAPNQPPINIFAPLTYSSSSGLSYGPVSNPFASTSSSNRSTGIFAGTGPFKGFDQKKKQQEKAPSLPKSSTSTEEKPDPTCKICMQKPTCMLNKKCNHLAMCDDCHKLLAAKERTNTVTCVICRAKGEYVKIFFS